MNERERRAAGAGRDANACIRQAPPCTRLCTRLCTRSHASLQTTGPRSKAGRPEPPRPRVGTMSPAAAEPPRAALFPPPDSGWRAWLPLAQPISQTRGCQARCRVPPPRPPQPPACCAPPPPPPAPAPACCMMHGEGGEGGGNQSAGRACSAPKRCVALALCAFLAAASLAALRPPPPARAPAPAQQHVGRQRGTRPGQPLHNVFGASRQRALAHQRRQRGAAGGGGGVRDDQIQRGAATAAAACRRRLPAAGGRQLAAARLDHVAARGREV